MSEMEAIASGFQKHADRIKSMSQGKPPAAQAQLLAIADQYEKHAAALLARMRVNGAGDRPWVNSARG